MTILIEPKRHKTGVLYHTCPTTKQRLEDPHKNATSIQKSLSTIGGARWSLPCCSHCCMELTGTKYRVHSDYDDGSVKLWEFEPPKAYAEKGKLKGLDVIESPAHTWVEPKLDGVRIITHVVPEGVFMRTRNRNDSGRYTQVQDNFPRLRDSPVLSCLRRTGHTYVLDGEVIMPAREDAPTLQATMGVVGAKPERAVQTQMEHGWATLHLFDIAMWRDQDITHLPLVHRREHLAELDLIADPSINLIQYQLVASAEAKRGLYEDFVDEGLEGAILKDPTAAYFDSRAWLKCKGTVTIDAIVTGWEPGLPETKYAKTLGALRLSVYNQHGATVEIARSQPGDDETRARLYAELSPLTDEAILNLRMIVEIEGQLLTPDGRVRHPRIIRFRPDRSDPNTLTL